MDGDKVISALKEIVLESKKQTHILTQMLEKLYNLQVTNVPKWGSKIPLAEIETTENLLRENKS